MKKRVVHPQDLPTGLPVSGTIAVCLLLDRLHISKTAWAAWITILSVWWLGTLYNIFEERRTPLRELNGKEDA